MKTILRLLCIVLTAIALLVTITACGGKTSTEEQPTTAAPTTGAPTTSAPTTEEPATDSPVPATETPVPATTEPHLNASTSGSPAVVEW